MALEDARRRLPSVGRLVESEAMEPAVREHGRAAVVGALRGVLEQTREAGAGDWSEASLIAAATEALKGRFGGRTRRVLNATGVLLHTNLGRAPLPRRAVEAVLEAGVSACDLEIDLFNNRRGERLRRVAARLEHLTGAEAAIVANNAAAGLVLAVAALASGREVVVSRGELVEIGGSFRIPEIIAAAGGRLVEVGTTNRTRLGDYRRALGAATGMVLKVSRSNFDVSGFTEEVEPAALASLVDQYQLPLVVDEGSGLLAPSASRTLARKRSMRELLADGADLVVGSGDKLLGGPQAGLMVGARDLVAQCRRHPLYRALRPGKMILVALEAVLADRMAGVPDAAQALEPTAALEDRVRRVAERVGATIGQEPAELGGGAGADVALLGPVVELPASERLAQRLRLGDPAILGYVRDGRLILDLRTVAAEDDEMFAAALLRALEQG